MPRSKGLRALLALPALVAMLAAGCSDDEEPSGGRASTAAETAPAETPKTTGQSGKAAKKERRRGEKAARGAKKRSVSKAELEKERRALKREAKRDRREDRKFDRAFRETAFEKIVGELPIRKPPLFVEQYITEDGSATVHTAVDPKRFFCGRSLARRKAAVSAFYRDADRLFRRRGVDDFVQIVTPIAETTERLPALAVGRGGEVSLTKRGRGKGPC